MCIKFIVIKLTKSSAKINIMFGFAGDFSTSAASMIGSSKQISHKNHIVYLEN